MSGRRKKDAAKNTPRPTGFHAGSVYMMDANAMRYLASGMRAAIGEARIETVVDGDCYRVRLTQSIDMDAIRGAAENAVRFGSVVVLKCDE